VRFFGIYVAEVRPADIGRQLVLGSATVRTHLSRIYKKLGLSGRAAAVAVAFRTRLID
jgi:DNA-binding CsgD family transcriptional regulator